MRGLFHYPAVMAIVRALVASLLVAMPAAGGAEAFGEWEYRENDRVHQALVVVEAPGADGFGAIVVRCDVAGLSVFVDVGAPLVVRRPVAVEFQFDASPESSARWHPSRDGVGTFAPDARGRADELARRYHLTFTALDRDGERHRVDFPLLGSAAAIRPVLAACT